MPAKKSSTQLKQAETLCIDDHQMNPDDSKVIGELASVCAQIVPQMLVLGKNWPPRHSLDSDYVGSSCHKMDQSMPQKMSEAHQLHFGSRKNVASIALLVTNLKNCVCIVGDSTFVPISWMCKKQTAASHSGAQAEVISSGAGVRM